MRLLSVQRPADANRPASAAGKVTAPRLLVIRVLALPAICSALAGCGTLQPPQPWERGLLAKPAMRMDGDPLQQRFDQHIYTSKENASGGTGIGGGGCGCN